MNSKTKSIFSIFNKVISTRIFWPILVVTVAYFSFNSLIGPGYFPMHDDMQAFRLLQMDKCFHDGQIPCRWVPDAGYGYGYPQFIFYSPLPYYFMEIFHLLGFSFLASVKIGFIGSFVFSALSMFLFARALFGNLGGLVSAVFYIYAPYRASDVYSRGAVGEFWALVFLPLILWSIFNLVKKYRQRQAFIFFSLSLSGLLLTHNLTTIAFAPIALIWALLCLVYFRDKKAIKPLILSGLLGLGLSAFFTLPLVIEKPWVHLDSMISGYFNYLAHYVSIGQMFLRGHWGYGSSELGPHDDLSFSIGPTHWLILVLSVALLFSQKIYSKNKFIFFSSFFFTVTFLFSVFMAHSKSTFVWQALPFLAYFQFPWRFLTLSVLSTSILAGVPILLIKKHHLAPYFTAAIIFITVFFNSRLFRPSQILPITDADKFAPESWDHQATMSIYDYLPVSASQPPSQAALPQPRVISGNANFSHFTQGTNWQQGNFTVTSANATIQLQQFYYPGFSLTLDGQDQNFSYDNQLGLITFNTSSGPHEFRLQLNRTLDQIVGDYISLFSLIIIIVLCFL